MKDLKTFIKLPGTALLLFSGKLYIVFILSGLRYEKDLRSDSLLIIWINPTTFFYQIGSFPVEQRPACRAAIWRVTLSFDTSWLHSIIALALIPQEYLTIVSKMYSYWEAIRDTESLQMKKYYRKKCFRWRVITGCSNVRTEQCHVDRYMIKIRTRRLQCNLN